MMNGLKILFLALLMSCVMLFVGCEVFMDTLLPSTDFNDDLYGGDVINDNEEGSDVDGEYGDDSNKDHTCVFGAWEVGYDSTCEAEGEEICRCLDCGKFQTRPIAKKGHNVVIDEASAPTDGVPGKTEGKHCSVCGLVILRQEYIYSDSYTDPSKYSSDYAYNYLLTNYDNGANLQAFYSEIDELAEYFHSSSSDAKTKTVSGKTFYYVAELDFSSYLLSSEEAIAVWAAYRMDHPLYYWMSNNVSYLSNSMSIGVFEEYVDGDVRTEYNTMLYNAVEEYIDSLEGRGSNYQIALSFHDDIIFSADYAYEDDGVTPQDDAFAHNVLGVMIFREGVCESYTKAFQLLLNYCGVENVYVTGYAKENHAWNLVKMDDGEWYWFDLTWDDTPRHGLGIKYSYFCVNDTDNVKIYDGATNNFGTFVQDHIPDGPVDFGINFNYSIPARSLNSFDYDGPMMRDEVIEYNGLSYVICGSDTCALVDISAEGDVVIPESITYKGFVYTVAVIGGFENGKIVCDPVVKADGATYKTPDITSITIPRTVKVIWDYAFIHAKTVVSYIVDGENEVYASQNDVLFTKNLYTLIQYPYASSATVYSVPSVTVEIAYGAFGDGGNVFYAKNLGNLYIGNNVTVVGAGHFGNGYRDSAPANSSEITVIDGYLAKLQKVYGYKLKIS